MVANSVGRAACGSTGPSRRPMRSNIVESTGASAIAAFARGSNSTVFQGERKNLDLRVECLAQRRCGEIVHRGKLFGEGGGVRGAGAKRQQAKQHPPHGRYSLPTLTHENKLQRRLRDNRREGGGAKASSARVDGLSRPELAPAVLSSAISCRLEDSIRAESAQKAEARAGFHFHKRWRGQSLRRW